MTDQGATEQQLQQALALARARIAELETVLAGQRGQLGHGPVPDRVAATRDLLELFARGSTRQQYLDSVRDLLARWTGCQCVGIRLVDVRERIPYATFCGFSRHFWEQENQLSLACDSCACVRVVKGQPEPHDLPFMTPGGSFILNDGTRFLECLTDQQKTRFRGSCLATGYRSLAVLPIRYRDSIIGAIHLTDARPAMLPRELVEFLEEVSPIIGEAAHRFDMEDSLRQTNELLESTFESIDLHLAYMDSNFNFIRVNRGYAAADGREPGWYVGRNHFDLFPNAENERIFRQVVETGVPYVVYERPFEYARSPQRGVTWWDWSLQPVKDADGSVRGVVLCLVNVTERKQAQHSVRQLERQILEVSSREQRRIGQDLHDVLGQQLTGLAFLSRILEQKLVEKAAPEADDARRMGEIIKQAISQTRALARGLCPIAPKAEGLMAALQAFADNVEEYYGISCRFCCEQPVLVDDVAVATHLYHIVQEAVNNAIKHGKSDQVTISLCRKGDALRLAVRDNGQGLPQPMNRGKGLGLSIMSYRAGMIGGSVDVKPHDEGGTIVVCTCRLAPGAAGAEPGISKAEPIQA